MWYPLASIYYFTHCAADDDDAWKCRQASVFVIQAGFEPPTVQEKEIVIWAPISIISMDLKTGMKIDWRKGHAIEKNERNEMTA